MQLSLKVLISSLIKPKSTFEVIYCSVNRILNDFEWFWVINLSYFKLWLLDTIVKYCTKVGTYLTYVIKCNNMKSFVFNFNIKNFRKKKL